MPDTSLLTAEEHITLMIGEPWPDDPHQYTWYDAQGNTCKFQWRQNGFRFENATGVTCVKDARALLKLKVPSLNPWEHWSLHTIAAISGGNIDGIQVSWPHVHEALYQIGQGSRNSQAAAIATMKVETATFMPVREAFYISPVFELAEQWRRNNLRYYPYYGRGHIQLTWIYNYLAGGNHIGVDLVNNPDLALESDNAAKLFAWYWAARNIGGIADRRDWPLVRSSVQGADAGLGELTNICNALLK